MRRRTYFIGAIVVAVVLALTAGITVARGQGGAALPVLTPAELMAKVAQEAPNVSVVSGDISWTNDLLGGVPLALPGGGDGLASLLQSGSGRFWYQDGKIRFESQGSGGDMVAVLNGRTAWVYSSQTGKATEYTLPEKPADVADGPTDTTEPVSAVDLPAKIQDMVQELAPYATLTVETGTAAGRDAYLLVMTPTATNAAIGTVQAAFDGETLLPLRAQVFAKGDAAPVLEAGFTTVSYDGFSEGTFDFTPPADATVEHTAVTLPADLGAMMGSAGHGKAEADESAKETPLTLDEAAAEAGFSLVTPADSVLPFKGAHVMTLPAGDPSAGGAAGSVPGGPADAADALAGILGDDPAPVVALRYGEGFGAVMVLETTVTDAQWTQATTALAQVPLFGTPSAFGGHQVYQLGTRLGSIVAWRQGDAVVLVGGSVPRTDLETFVTGMK